jgi:tetratricopeptide (TPR) repeat protein
MNKLLFFTLSVTFLLSACSPSNEQLIDEGNALAHQHKYQDAIATYTKVIIRTSKLQLPFYNRGIAYLSSKQYQKALSDFNRVIDMQGGEYINIVFNDHLPYANDEATNAQVPRLDVLYHRAQTKFYMDSLRSSFRDFQTLMDHDYSEKSNCILWQGTILFKSGNADKACAYFKKAKELAQTREDSIDADYMIKNYCEKDGKSK